MVFELDFHSSIVPKAVSPCSGVCIYKALAWPPLAAGPLSHGATDLPPYPGTVSCAHCASLRAELLLRLLC